MASTPDTRTTIYHCDACGEATTVDAAGTCPSGEPHAVDLLWHHRNAHNPLDEDGRDPDCIHCDDAVKAHTKESPDGDA